MQNADLNNRALELLRFTASHVRHVEALAKATGERFNIFQILGIGHREVITHSPILGELLNPKGSHGQGPIFLKLFLTYLEKNFQIHADFDLKSAKVDLEYSIAKIDERSGGRIDILISDSSGSPIIIENKIYAADQDNQLERYRTYRQKAYLLYLTLDGKLPSNYSVGDLEKIQCKCVSYEKDILTWLKECRKEAACLPNVRETITQYINLIKDLTNQSTNMNDDLIKKIVNNPENLAAFFELTNQEQAVKSNLAGQLYEKFDLLAKKYGFEFQKPLQGEDLSDGGEVGFYLSTKELDKHNLQIGFAFDKKNYRDFFYGYCRKFDAKKECSDNTKEEILSAFSTAFGKVESTHPFWSAFNYWEEYKDWDASTFEAILSGQFEKDLEIKIKKFEEITKKICPN